MYVCMCRYIYIYVCVYIYIYVIFNYLSIYLHISLFMFLVFCSYDTHANAHVCTCMHAGMQAYMPTYICFFAAACASLYVYVSY